MATRPFYLESQVDGRMSPLTGGPKRKDGSMKTYIYQRNKGEIDTACVIEQDTTYKQVYENDKWIEKQYLQTRIYLKGFLVGTYETEY